MWAYLVKRTITSFLVVLTVAILSFFLIRLAPGDPATLIAGEAASPEYIQTVRKQYGLDRPVAEQLIIYLSRFFRGDLGYSITFGAPVLSVILDRLPQTILLVGTSIVISFLLGLALGLLSAKKAFTIFDGLINAVTIILYSIPAFWLGLVLILVFALWYPIFPIGGMMDINISNGFLTRFLDVLHHLVLPSMTLSTFFLATYTRMTRAGLIEALGMNYIILAQAKGVPENKILRKHALKNALLPIITVLAIQLGLMVGGVVFTETIFSWPGVGSLLIQAVNYRDYPLVTGIFIFTSAAVALANFIADIVYMVVDPRIRTEGAK
ncbi:MAG: ABC transporter permease [Candidatus Caldarchaeum sp.]|nr:ABC transporter permease [Candidatus Caldarchaeum sp.]MDW8063654.1 ABC transporter permease [Candidatus Caldarchaeum sp.]MDW8435479.1 ABC transporter permease [Candidatus Caldarchaeum sp.]